MVVVSKEVELKGLLETSKEIADCVLRKSPILDKYLDNNKIEYKERVQYLKNLLGKDMHLDFHPKVTKSLVKDFKNSFGTPTPSFFGGKPVYASELPLNDGERRLTKVLFDEVTNENLLENTLPRDFKAWAEHLMTSYSDGEITKSLKTYKNATKLSKVLVKLWGEKSDVVKWYTTKCPKKLETGVLSEYKIVLSTLPHHIAGMSYYAPLNHGGDGWIEGYNGTSCMDTYQNGEGGTMLRLLPNMIDSYLAIAYLTKTNDNDILKPKYLARMLVKVVEVGNGKWAMLGLRSYHVSHEAKNILSDGLMNCFENFTDVRYLRDHYRNDEMKKFTNDTIIGVEQYYRCSVCRGRGEDDYETCEDCDGVGQIKNGDFSFPYVDDSDYIVLLPNTKRHRVKLPVQWLEDKGFIEVEKKEEELNVADSSSPKKIQPRFEAGGFRINAGNLTVDNDVVEVAVARSLNPNRGIVANIPNTPINREELVEAMNNVENINPITVNVRQWADADTFRHVDIPMGTVNPENIEFWRNATNDNDND